MANTITGNTLELGKTYISKQPLYYGDINDVTDSQAKWLKEHGYVEEDNSIVFPIGIKVTHTGRTGGAKEFMIEDMRFDFYLDEYTLFEEVEKVDDREKLLYDFYNSSVIDEIIINEILVLEPGSKRVPVEDHETRKAVIMKHIKKYLEGIS